MGIGCQKDTSNGTEIEYCICKEEGCNKEMGEISTSSTLPTTTQKGIYIISPNHKNITRDDILKSEFNFAN